MKAAVIGSRDLVDYDLIKQTLDRIDKIDVIIFRGSQGDSLGEPGRPFPE